MPHFGNNFSLAARQVVYGGGGINAGIQLARQGGKLAQLNAEDGKQRVCFLLTGLYLQLHNLRNGREVYAANAALARQLIEQMHKRREQGISLRNDITRYELQLQQMLLGETTLRDRESIVRRRVKHMQTWPRVGLQVLGGFRRAQRLRRIRHARNGGNI